MKIQHPVSILNRPTAYTAQVDNGKVHLTVPHIIFRDDLAHLTSRHDVIDDLPTVLRIYEHIDDHEPIEAWRLIGRVTGDVYLQGVK